MATAFFLASAATFLIVRPARRTNSNMEAGIKKLLPLSIQEYASKFPKQFNRLVYPYSIVPGGVDTAEDVQRAAAADPVVREHYKGLEFEKLRPIALGEARLAYVSYRKGDEVFWTSKKIRLFKGERLLTDGAKLVRARCGNLVSDTPVAIASREEPAGETLNTPTALAVSPLQFDNGDGLGPEPMLLAQAPAGASMEPADPLPAPSPEPAGTPDSSAGPQTAALFPPIAGLPGVRAPGNSGGGAGNPTTPVDPPSNPGSPSTAPTEPVPPDPPVTPPPTVMPPRTIPGTPPVIPNFPHRPGEPPVDPPGTDPNQPDPPSGPDDPPIPPVDPPLPPTTPVPEPSTWLLAGSAVIGLVLRRRARRCSQGAGTRPVGREELLDK